MPSGFREGTVGPQGRGLLLRGDLLRGPNRSILKDFAPHLFRHCLRAGHPLRIGTSRHGLPVGI